ncbi:MAG: hypothetical protein IKF91_02560 [Bacilli bacterium]|nr:hypothetical protein [Bacilli bacterium]
MLRIKVKEIKPGDTYLSLTGEEKQIKEAIDMGATCIITDKGDYEVKTILTPDTQTYLSNYLKELYFEKIDNIKIIGIVGAAGKTQTQEIVAQTLNNLNSKTAYIGDDIFNLEDKTENIKTNIYTIYEKIGQAIDNNCKNMIIELSNENLSKRQYEGLRFDIVIFTNLIGKEITDEYLKNSIEPFKMIKKDGYAIINKNDPYYENYSLTQNHNIYYGTLDSDYKITDVNLTYEFIEFTLNDIKIKLPILGSYNIYNFINAYIIAKLFNYNDEEIIESTKLLKQIEGRYQTVKNKDSLVIIDSASSEQKIKRIIEYTKEFSKGKITTVIGCDSEIEKEERKKIGFIVTQMTDYTIFTSDNPRYEEPEQIIEDMTKSLETDNYEIILNRKEAIKKGINLLKDKDILLILGKGNEQYQIIGDDELTYSDYKEVMKNIKK